MSETPVPHGPYTLWQNHGYDGWSFDDFPTLKEALEADKYGAGWHISKPVGYSVIDDDPDLKAKSPAK